MIWIRKAMFFLRVTSSTFLNSIELRFFVLFTSPLFRNGEFDIVAVCRCVVGCFCWCFKLAQSKARGTSQHICDEKAFNRWIWSEGIRCFITSQLPNPIQLSIWFAIFQEFVTNLATKSCCLSPFSYVFCCGCSMGLTFCSKLLEDRD